MKANGLGSRALRLEIPPTGFPKLEPSARLGTSTPAPEALSIPINRAASPDTAARAPSQAEALDFLKHHPDVGELHMWDKGQLPLFPTGKRAPSQLETVSLRDFAQRVNQHRNSKIKGAFVPNRLDQNDPLAKGEYTASYNGPKQPAERIYRSNFEYAERALSGVKSTEKISPSRNWCLRP